MRLKRELPCSDEKNASRQPESDENAQDTTPSGQFDRIWKEWAEDIGVPGTTNLPAGILLPTKGTTLGKTSAGSEKSAIEPGVVAAGIIASIIFLVLVVVAFVLVRRKNRKKQREESVK
ncbi:Hypothetical predicted protein, partial [Paramuricea clavata]